MQRKLSHNEVKFMTSRIYELCHKLYGNEFFKMYLMPKTEFIEWLNKKTGLNENLILDPVKATINWYDELELAYKKSKRT